MVEIVVLQISVIVIFFFKNFELNFKGEGTGYAGALCNVKINECLQKPGPCDNMTSCVNTETGFYCTPCPTGYFGNGIIKDGGCFQCNPSCLNGDCIGPNTCNCSSGWSGDQCQTAVPNNQCTISCDPLTQCIIFNGTSSCTSCPSGYSGSGESGCVKSNEPTKSNSSNQRSITSTFIILFLLNLYYFP